jgi:hypothetical protein
MMWYCKLSTSQFRSFVFKSDSDTKSFLSNSVGQMKKKGYRQTDNRHKLQQIHLGRNGHNEKDGLSERAWDRKNG